MVSRIVSTSLLLSACLVAPGCIDDGFPAPTDHPLQSGDSGSGGSDGAGGGGGQGEHEHPAGSGGGSSTSQDKPLYYVQAGEQQAEATKTPWSSWWYPVWDDALFQGKNGEMSPLEKYDAYAREFMAQPTKAAEVERTQIHDARAVSWAGLCDAWAIASVLEPEPTRPLRNGTLTFSVGDQKALLLKTYENVPGLQSVGKRNDGKWDDDFEDVYPQFLHAVIMSELIEKRKAFIIDDDAGPEVWNAPAYRVITDVTRDPANDKVVHVRTYLFTASPHVDDVNFVGTKEVTHQYTYDLTGAWEGTRFGVRGGQWTDRSRWDHPDYAIILPAHVQRGSLNKEIRVDIVDRILHRPLPTASN
jgi:hypothetical protein